MPDFLISYPDHLVITGLLTAALVAALLVRPGSRWLVASLAAVAVAAACFMSATYFRIFEKPYSNYTHYYLGAKYRLDYFDFYKILRAARGEPLARYRDLRSYPSGGIVNDDPEEEGRYYRELLKAYGFPADGALDVDTLRSLCAGAGILEREAKSVLAQTGLDAARIAELEADARAGQILFRDHGFNGSPFYVLLRRLDPALYFPLSIASFRWSVALELVLVILAGLLVARTFKLGIAGLLLFVTLLFTTWELMGWNLSGLVFMAWFFPFCFALRLVERGKASAAGAVLAAAILLKIFPGAALLPVVASLAIRIFRERSCRIGEPESRLLLSTALTLALLGAIASTQGDWGQWLEKVRGQFEAQSGARLNNVSLFNTWYLATRAQDTGTAPALWIPWAGRAAFVAALALLVTRLPAGVSSLPQVMVFSLAALPWITVDVSHYYLPGVGALVLALLFTRGRRYFAPLALLLLANQLLLDYHEARRLGALLWLKNAYWFLTPAALYLALWRSGVRVASGPPEKAPLVGQSGTGSSPNSRPAGTP